MKKQDFIFKWVIYPHGINDTGDKAIFKGFISINRRPQSSNAGTLQQGDFRQSLSALNIKNVNQILGWIREEPNIVNKSSDENNSRFWLYIKKGDQGINGPTLTRSSQSAIDIKVPDFLNGVAAEEIGINGYSFFSVQPENRKNDNVIKDINEDEYDSILNKGREYAIDNADQFNNDQSFNLITFYSKLLEEPILAEKLGLVHEFHLPLSPDFFEEWGAEVKYNLSSNLEKSNSVNDFPFLLSAHESGDIFKYYNGYTTPFLDKDDFKSVDGVYYDEYKKSLNSRRIIENDGIYINVHYSNNEDPFEKKDIFGYNVLLFKQKIQNEDKFQLPDLGNKSPQSLSLLKREYFMNNELLATDISSGFLLPKPTLQISDTEEYRARLLFAWKGENLALNRAKRNRMINPSEEEFDNVATKNNDDIILNSLLDFNFTVNESFIPKTNPHLEASNNLIYFFYLRPVTGLNYYLETKEEWRLRNPEKTIPQKTKFFDDFINDKRLHREAIFKEICFPKFKIDSPVIIAREKFDNENTPFVDSKNSMVVNLKNKEKLEKRFLYPARITWEKFKMLGFLKKDKIKSNNINQYVRRCIRLEKRSLKDIRCRQGIDKKINYLADPRATKIQILPNDLFTASYFAAIPSIEKNKLIQHVFELDETFPFFKKARAAKVRAERSGLKNGITIDKKVFLDNIPLGAYSIKLHSLNQDNDSIIEYESGNEIIDVEKNGEPLNFAFVDRPSKPKTNRENHITERLNNQEKNKWRLSYELAETIGKHIMFSTKSIKFYERTEVLLLQKDRLTEMKNDFSGNLDSLDLLNDEYPVEFFIKKEGNLKENLQAKSYPKKLKLSLQFEENLCIDNQEVFKLRLSETDEISVIADSKNSLIKLWYNGASLSFSSKKQEGKCYYYLNLWIEYCTSEERYEIFAEKAYFIEDSTVSRSLYLNNLINPEISIRDIQVNSKLCKLLDVTKENIVDVKKEDKSTNQIEVNGLEYLSQTYDKNKIKLYREPREVILKDEGHPYYRKKTIRLFASSAFQAYFPKISMEKKIGRKGQKFDFEVLNNIVPEKPELDTNLLLYSHQQKSWGNNNQISDERNFLVRMTFDKTFMKEGTKNRFAIILGEYKDDSFAELLNEEENSSLIGEDITKLINEGVIKSNNLEPYINTNPKRKELAKYFVKEEVEEEGKEKSALDKFFSLTGISKKVKINNCFYKVLISQPYYNTHLEKWQIVLSFKNFMHIQNLNESYEAFFVRLIGFKISYGKGVSKGKSPYFLIHNSPHQTIVSDLTEPQIIPVYNRKKYILKRDENQLTIINEGHRKDEKNKIYVLSKLKTRTDSNLFVDSEGGLLYNSKSFDLSESNSFSFSNENYKEIIIREFEKHDNYDENNTDFSRFPIKGLRLINYVQFKI